MNGVMSPAVSAGSKNVGAMEKCVASVSCPSGAADAHAGRSSASASTPATTYRARCLIDSSPPPGSGVQDDFQRIARALLEHVDRLVDATERELVRDERLGGEPPGGEQRQRAADAGTALAALGIDRDVAPHRVADVGGDGTAIEGHQQHLGPRLCHADGLVERLVAPRAVDDE